MALRNIDTEFYKKGFVRSLPANLKLFYSYIMTDCEMSGVWVKDLELASLYTGSVVTEEVFKATFVDQGKAIDLNNGKYFMPEFIKMQYPKGLNKNNTSHKNVISELMGYGLLNSDLTIKNIDDEKTGIVKKMAVEIKQSVESGLKKWIEEKGSVDKEKIKETKDHDSLQAEQESKPILEIEEVGTITKIEPKKKEPKEPRVRFLKPTLIEVSVFFISIGVKGEAEKFMNHYESVGWKVGQKSMVDWKAACRGWKTRMGEFKANQPKESYKEQLAKATGNEHRISENEGNT